MQSKNSENYLRIAIDLDESPSKGDLDIVNSINNEFSKNGFYFNIDNTILEFYLHSIDLDSFRQRLKNLINETKKITDIHENAFDNIIAKIEKIGSYGIKSGKRIYVGYNKERKVKNRQDKVIKRNSYYYAANHDFTKELNEIPREFENTIICGDSESILQKLPSNCVDIVFTSPPYNFGLGYDAGEDGIHWESYFAKLFSIFDECIRVLKYGGRIIVNIQPLFSDYIPSHQIIGNYFMQKKLIWKGEILWEKNNYNCKYTAWGSWKSPSNPYLKYTWEFLEIFSKGELKKTGSSEDIDITGEEFKKWVVAKWSIAPERNMKKFEHPAMFPEELVERILKLFSYQNDIVLDPFNGVGTTTLVAKKFKRRYLGIDISEDYCRKAENRLKEVL